VGNRVGNGAKFHIPYARKQLLPRMRNRILTGHE
jgi:hypothetical protein